MKTGILLVNLGTPNSPSISDVRKYLREFLSDPMVIDVPWLVRQIILYGFILPFRPKQSAHAYQQIWLEEGSPLLIYSQRFAEKLRASICQPIAVGMRYGEPSIRNAINSLLKQDCNKIIAVPMFPQYSTAASGSAIAEIQKQMPENIELEIYESFYDESFYLEPLAQLIAKEAMAFKPDFILFSYHGVPVRQSEKSRCKVGRDYRQQCCFTTQAVADRLQLDAAYYATAFQSRLGKTPWIEPYTDLFLPQLLERGIEKLMVVCPSFVADCLETQEEIGLRLREQWLELGGESLQLVPCLNDNSQWVQSFATRLNSSISMNIDMMPLSGVTKGSVSAISK